MSPRSQNRDRGHPGSSHPTHGFVMELNGVTDAGAISRATFHRSPLSPGIWVELVDQDLADWIAQWLSEAATEQGIPFKSPFVWDQPEGG